MKISLILEGGGMRGLYTCGVLDFFIKKNINFDLLAAVSAGTGAACSYLSKQLGRGAAVNLDYVNDKRYLSVSNLLRSGSAFGLDFILYTIPDKLNPFDYETFHKNPTAFYTVCTDIESGEAYYKRMINLRTDMEYIKASMSLPLISPIVSLDGRQLMDGGIADSIPVNFAKSKGCEKHVVVLTQYPDYRKGKNNLMPIIRYNYKQYPNLIKALEERHIHYNETLEELHAMEKKGEVFIIQPQKPVTISRLETNKEKLIDLYQDGYKDAARLYDDLMKFMG